MTHTDRPDLEAFCWQILEMILDLEIPEDQDDEWGPRPIDLEPFVECFNGLPEDDKVELSSTWRVALKFLEASRNKEMARKAIRPILIQLSLQHVQDDHARFAQSVTTRLRDIETSDLCGPALEDTGERRPAFIDDPHFKDLRTQPLVFPLSPNSEAVPHLVDDDWRGRLQVISPPEPEPEPEPKPANDNNNMFPWRMVTAGSLALVIVMALSVILVMDRALSRYSDLEKEVRALRVGLKAMNSPRRVTVTPGKPFRIVVAGPGGLDAWDVRFERIALTDHSGISEIIPWDDLRDHGISFTLSTDMAALTTHWSVP